MSNFTEYALGDKPPQTIASEIAESIFNFIQSETLQVYTIKLQSISGCLTKTYVHIT